MAAVLVPMMMGASNWGLGLLGASLVFVTLEGAIMRGAKGEGRQAPDLVRVWLRAVVGAALLVTSIIW